MMPISMRTLSLTVPLATLLACAAPAPGEDPQSTSSDLSRTDPLSSAVAGTCDLTAIQGLDEQLVGEIQCLHPGALVSISGDPHLTFGPQVFRYLQVPAAEHLRTVVAARGSVLHLNDALRALPEQYVLYHWYLTGRCGIALAASPGHSNHESGLAVDVQDSVGWRTYFDSNGFRWFGASDPVHYDYIGGGAVVDITGLSVLAFQKLWNLNHPADKIGEDGAYGPETEARLVQAPLGGFALATTCVDGGAASGKNDAGEHDAEGGPAEVDDAGASVEPVTNERDGATASPGVASDPGGCATSGSRSPKDPRGAWAIAIGLVALLKRRARSR